MKIHGHNNYSKRINQKRGISGYTSQRIRGNFTHFRKKTSTKLDKDLAEALREVKQGKLIGPFEDAKDLIKSLNSKK